MSHPAHPLATDSGGRITGGDSDGDHEHADGLPVRRPGERPRVGREPATPGPATRSPRSLLRGDRRLPVRWSPPSAVVAGGPRRSCPSPRTSFVARCGGSSSSAAATATLFVVAALLRRLLPLAALLRLSLAFPDQAPSRFRIARRTATLQQAAGAGGRRPRRRRRRPSTPTDATTSIRRCLELVASLAHHDRITRGHCERVRAYCNLIGEELALDREDLAAPAVGRPPPRCREGRRAEQRAEQARSPHAVRVGADQAAPGDRRPADPLARAVARRLGARRRGAPRAMGRRRVPQGAPRHGDQPGGADHRRGRCVRRDDRRPVVQGSAPARRRPAPSSCAAPAPSSTTGSYGPSWRCPSASCDGSWGHRRPSRRSRSSGRCC